MDEKANGVAMADLGGEGGVALRKFLAALVVPGEVTIEDIDGKVYAFRPVLTARRQIQASLVLERMISRGVSAPNMTLTSGGVAMIQTVGRFLTEVAAGDDLDDLFRVIHPTIDLGGRSVLDAFEVDQLVQALLPFFARFATRTAAVLGVTAATVPPTEPGAASD